MAILETAVLLLQAKNYGGSGNWLDESGNSHDATLVGSPAWDGSKFTLTGSQNFSVADHADLDIELVTSFTALAWVTIATGNVAFGMILNKQPSGAGWEIDCGSDSTTIRVKADDGPGGGAVTLATKAATLDTPGFAFLRRDVSAGNLAAGWNTAGTPVTDTSSQSIANANDLGIGAALPTSLRFKGDIYAVAIWRSALSDADVATALVELQTKPALLSALGVG